MKETKCIKCGKVMPLKKIKDTKQPQCPHCNLKHQFDVKTKKKITIITGIVLMILILIITSIMTIFNFEWFIMIVPAILIGIFIDNIAVFIAKNFNLLRYEKDNTNAK